MIVPFDSWLVTTKPPLPTWGMNCLAANGSLFFQERVREGLVVTLFEGGNGDLFFCEVCPSGDYKLTATL